MKKQVKSFTLALAVVATACGGGSQPGQAVSPSAPTAAATNVSFDKNDYPVFQDADAGADPSVPAEQGGKGFTGEGWETNVDFDLLGDPRAVKGGVFREAMGDFPATLRYLGPNLSVWNAMLSGLVYESLLGQDPITLKYLPALASHWQIAPDKKTFRFRIDPNARFSDGTPVLAEDVVATWKLFTDPTVQDPFRNAEYGKFDTPVAESKYITRVVAKEVSWMSLLIFSGMPVYPAQALRDITGEQYVKEWNDRMLPGSGPYQVTPADLDKGKTIKIRRRTNYWAEKYRRNIGFGNFDEIREVVVRDRNLEFEMLKKGDLDYYTVNRAQMWAEELDFDKIQRGLLQKRKVWNHSPESIQGIAFNMRRPPYNDVRVRKALRLLFNRELMIEKLMFNEYVPMDSVFPGSIYQNQENERIQFDPEAAIALLAEAGWQERNQQGLLIKGGTPLALELLYYSKSSEKILTVWQDDLKKVGVTLHLRYVTPETAFKMLDDQTFGMFSVGYGGGGVFPLPSQFYDSKMADQKGTNNTTGFKNTRVDEILKAYETEFDLAKRAMLLQELDGIVMSEHPYLLEWMAPFQRFVYWNKFGQPKGLISRIGDSRDPVGLWWLDPQKNYDLETARRDPSKQLPVGESEDKYWLTFDRLEEKAGGMAETGKS
jgi:microcin C transport system substrate-binding protein